ncbi:MAG: Acg family FMN-binding oxidoreductase [Rhodoferax sp.]
MMQRRRFLRLAGGGTVAAATASGLGACASTMPEEAIGAWQVPLTPPAQGDLRHWLLSIALLAPHSHNLQSWVADLRHSGQILLYCDPQRTLPETDPLSRQIVMSHGSFLELLDLAARQAGVRADITLFPEGAFSGALPDGRPIARVTLQTDARVRPDPLLAQVPLRHTNRSVYERERAVPPQAWQALAHGAQDAPQVRMGYADGADPAALQEHRRIANEAWRIELTTPAKILESYHWLRVGAREVAQHRDGLSLLSPVPVWLDRLGWLDRRVAPAPDSFATTSQLQDFADKIASTPAFVWLSTPDNTRATQIAAGRAYARLQLATTAQGLAMQPLSQALQEYPEQQATYAAIHRLCGAAPGHTVQMWARVGYAAAVPPAPRRGLAALLRTGA